MKYIEAPNTYNQDLLGNSMFLAGGITNCPNWQQEMAQLLSSTNLTLLNPRREDFPIGDQAAFGQIGWEHNALRAVKSILFWFPRETICPIVLYELGAWSMKDKPIFVGVHPEYKRRQDVEIQTGWVRPNVEIVYSLTDLANQIKDSEVFLSV